MNRLKELREERGYSVRGMELRTKINYNSICKYENETRDPGTKTLKILADFFQVTIDYLLCYSNYCLYAKYKEGNFFFKINENYYKELKEKKYIYFDKNDHRCIDINSLIGIKSNINAMGLFEEFTRINNVESLLEKGIPSEDDIEKINGDITEIELNRTLVKQIKDAIK